VFETKNFSILLLLFFSYSINAQKVLNPSFEGVSTLGVCLPNWFPIDKKSTPDC
jgi:hypothetical protein